MTPPAETGVLERTGRPPGPYSWRDAARPGFMVSDDPALLDLSLIHATLERMYWCQGIPRSVVERAAAHSMPFGVFEPAGSQVGYARVISDRATFAYLADVFIIESHRERGLSKLLVGAIRAHPDLQGLRRWMLLTRDAHGLYRQFGFGGPAHADRIMECVDAEVYQRAGAAEGER